MLSTETVDYPEFVLKNTTIKLMKRSEIGLTDWIFFKFIHICYYKKFNFLKKQKMYEKLLKKYNSLKNKEKIKMMLYRTVFLKPHKHKP